MEDEKVYTTSEVADILGIQVRTVNDYCKDGRLTAFKRGARNFVTQESVEQYMSRTRKNKVQLRPKSTVIK